MSQLFDDLARTLATSMPRRRAVRVLGGALVSIAVPGIAARKARAASSFHDCEAKGGELCECNCKGEVCQRRCCTPKEDYECFCGPVEYGAACKEKNRCKPGTFGCGDTCCQDGWYCCDRTFSLKEPRCCDPEEAVKDACKDTEVASMILLVALGAAAAFTGGLALLVVGGLAAGVGLGGVGAKICGDDPPDPKYKELFKPRIPRPAPVRAGNGITAAAASALNRTIENRIRAGAYSIAWIRSIEKAQGADKGGDKTWARRHRTAAAGYAREAARTLERDKALTTAAQRALTASGFVDTGATLAQARQYQQRVKVAGLPKELARALGDSDVGASRIASYRKAITRLDPKLVEGVGIFGNLTDPRLAEANTKLIKTLRLSARTLAKG